MHYIITKSENRYTGLPGLMLYLESAPDGLYEITIRKRRKTRTTPQNDYLWGVVYTELLLGLQNAGWEDITETDKVHRFFIELFATEQLINKHTGEVVTIPSSTTEMDTVTFTTYMDKLKEYASEYLSIEISDPEIQLKK